VEDDHLIREKLRIYLKNVYGNGKQAMQFLKDYGFNFDEDSYLGGWGKKDFTLEEAKIA